METIVKNNVGVLKLKNDIKVLVEKQKIYRNQKKTVHIVGERTMDASEAEVLHRSTGQKLRVMYAVYGLLRGKSYSQIENNHLEDEHPLKKLYQYDIDKLMKMYESIQ